MKSWLIRLLALSTLLLAGCATVIRSDVTSFHEWPAELRDTNYVFERTRDQNNDLEYLNYENLVREQLQRLGFIEAGVSTRPALKVTLSYSNNGRDVREVYPVVVRPYPPAFWPGYYGHPFYGPYGPWGPFYDPFWYGPPVVEQRVSQYQLFTRELKIVIARMEDGKRLRETTVSSEGTNPSLAAVMPYMIRSAFAEFPGPNGQPRRIELKMD